MTKERIQGHLCILTANVIFGIYIPISKWILADYLSGEVLTLFRMWGATLLFWFASLFIEKDKLDKKDILLTFIFAFLGIALNQGLFIYGLGKTSPIDASVIVTATPLMVMVIAALFMKDPITKQKGLGVALGASGALWLIFSTGKIASSTGSFYGDSIILISGLSTAIYYALSKPLSKRHNSITLMKWMFLFSTLIFMPLTPSFLLEDNAFKGEINCVSLPAIIYIIVGATFITYLLIAMAIRRLRPTTMAMYNYVQPLISSLMAIILCQDSFSIEKLGAAFFIFFGVYLVTTAKSPATKEA